MSKKLLFLFLSVYSLCIIGNSYSQPLQGPFDLTPQNINMKFSLKYQITQTSYIEVPDTLNHRLGTAIGTGIALFNDSISIPVKSYFVYDYVDGNGNFIDYYVFTFPNGSSFGVQALGIAQGSNATGNNPLFQSTTRTTVGTGDFANFIATGVMSGNRNIVVENNAQVRLTFDMKQIIQP